MTKTLLKILLIIFLLILQISFFVNFEFLRDKLNIILIMLTFFILTFGFQQSLIWGIVCGYFLDYYSSLPFGYFSLSIIITLIIIYLLFHHYLANRSIITLILLVATATISFNFLIIFFDFFISLFGFTQFNFDLSHLINIIWQTILNTSLSVFCFIIYNFINSKFHRSFWLKGNL